MWTLGKFVCWINDTEELKTRGAECQALMWIYDVQHLEMLNHLANGVYV